MKKILSIVAFAMLAFSTASALEPAKVAIVNTSATPVSVVIELVDYTGGTANVIYTQPAANYTPNSSGIIIANISGAGWTAITAASVNSYYILNVKVGGTLTAQYRLDQLIIDQAQGGVLDTDGNLTPPESGTASIGNDGNRWEGAYVTGNTLHVGPVDGEANNTELAISYNTGIATLKVDNVDVVDLSNAGVVINKIISQNLGNSNVSISGSLFPVIPTGSHNTAIGETALVKNSLGGFNTAIGSSNLSSNIDGGSNTAVGVSSLYTNVSGNSNVALGNNTLNQSTGSNNTVVGFGAGQYITTGTNNVFLGFAAGNTGTQKLDAVNSIAIGYQAETTADNQVVIGNSSITETQLRGATLADLTGVTTRNIAVNTAGKIVTAESSVITDATLTGNGTTATPLSLADGSVSTAKIVAGAVTTGKLDALAVTTGKIDAQAVTTGKIADAAVTAIKINTGAVNTAKIANGTILNEDIDAAASIAYSKLDLANSIQTSDLTANSVKTGKINDKAVTPAKIANGTTNGQVLTYNGTDAAWSAPVVVSATAPTAPVTGMLWYDTNATALKIWNGSAWVAV